jgi:fatty-acyl-CoA synthase
MGEAASRISNESIGERFLGLAAAQPDRTWCTYFSGVAGPQIASYGHLRDRALEFATAFGNRGPARKRVAVCLYPSLDLHAAFLGAILAGHIPAMMPPFSPKTEPSKLQKTIGHFLDSMHPDLVVIDNETNGSLQSASVRLGSEVKVISPSDARGRGGVIALQGGGGDIAFIQHSSGTTGLQKGVALSHGSVIRHHESYSRAIGLRWKEDSIVSWLPLYHDMGLISCFMVPLLAGLSIVEIPTLAWAGRPGLLFDAITAHRPTLCWLPNFAYTFLAQTLQRNLPGSSWDLSSVRLWTNCSEPITDRSQRAFLQAFESIGCNPESLGSSYAMAENVFAVTQSTNPLNAALEVSKGALSRHSVAPPESAEDTRVLISCGAPVEGVRIKTLEPGSDASSRNDVGEIAIKSDFLFTEYWKNPDATSKAFTADGYFRTGDSGFVKGDDVFVTGRLKDIIIIQGKNFHAGDIEACLAGVEGTIPGRVVALGMMDESMGSERLVVLAESSATEAAQRKSITDSIRTRIFAELGVPVSMTRLLPPRWLIKSTSGKMARLENKDKFLKSLEEKNV